MATTRPDVSQRLAEIGRRFDQRGWMLGTSGNLSGVVEREPLRLAITPSGVSKGDLSAEQILEIDATGAVTHGVGAPSAEARLHVELIRARGPAPCSTRIRSGARCSPIVTRRRGGLAIEGYEMLKGLEGVRTHEHREWIPILENDQDMSRLAGRLQDALSRNPACHAFLLRRHGMYTWGDSLAQAVRHVEIVEFLLEAVGRAH